MPPQASPSLVDEIVPFREKMSNQRALNDRNALRGVLPGASPVKANAHNALTLFCILEVKHKGQVISMPPYATANVIRFADVKSLEATIAAASAKYINAGSIR